MSSSVWVIFHIESETISFRYFQNDKTMSSEKIWCIYEITEATYRFSV